MIKGFFSLFIVFYLFSCTNIEFVLNDDLPSNRLNKETLITYNNNNNEMFDQELLSFLGNNEKGDFILETKLEETKENRLVKKNQVAEKVDYKITVEYKVFHMTRDCQIYNQKIVSKFSFVPKSFGYNFGTDRSFEKLYKGAVKKNIINFINSLPTNNNCIK